MPASYEPPPPRHDSCVLVKTDGHDRWADALDKIQPIPVPNYNPGGFDAMQLPSAVGGSRNWTPTAMRTYGGRDIDGRPMLEQHVPARYGDSLARIKMA
jgi:hypothetical protein